jgi:hypothetical protein
VLAYYKPSFLKEGEFWYCRYWNDKEVLLKLGEAMGLSVSGDAATSAEHSGPDEAEDLSSEEESIVHHTASVGDVEVWHSTFAFIPFRCCLVGHSCKDMGLF